MGRWFVWFQKDNVAELKLDREKLEEKRAKLDEEIETISQRITELESKDESSD